MEKARIHLIEGCYTYKGADSRDLEILAIFLTDDVETGRYCRVEFYQEWIEKPELRKTAGMATNLRKDGSDIVLTDYVDSMKDNHDFDGWKDVYIGGQCSMSSDEFLSVLKEWKQCTDGRPEEILVIKDGQTFRLEAKKERDASIYKSLKHSLVDPEDSQNVIVRNMFPAEWTPKETVTAVASSLKNALDSQKFGKKLRIFCTTPDGLRVMQIAGKDGKTAKMLMAYPLVGNIKKD